MARRDNSLIGSAFTLGVRDSNVESFNIMLVI
jgi:hypothetical protein